jgi:hypothetical protein
MKLPMLFSLERTILFMVQIHLYIQRARVGGFNSQQILGYIKMEPKRLIKRVSLALVAGGNAADSRAEVEAHQEKGLIRLIIREGRRIRE